MSTKTFLSLVFIVVFSIILLSISHQTVYAIECDPSEEAKKAQSYDASYCKEKSPCKIDCVQAPGKPEGWVCCLKGCVGEPCAPGQICFENPLSYCTFGDLVDSIINFIFLISLVIAPLMIIIAAGYFITSGGNPKQVDTAKKIILYTVIGLLVVFLSRAIIAVIQGVFK